MKDYSGMSDVEINKSVAISSGKNVKLIKLDSDDQECAVIVGEKFTVEKKEFDPCNNPADAWPIIEENNISIINDSPELRIAVTSVNDLWHDDAVYGDGYYQEANKNGLRAAMIVYLMMKDAEKGHG